MVLKGYDTVVNMWCDEICVSADVRLPFVDNCLLLRLFAVSWTFLEGNNLANGFHTQTSIINAFNRLNVIK